MTTEQQLREQAEQKQEASVAPLRERVDVLEELKKALQADIERLDKEAAAARETGGSVSDRLGRLEDEVRQLRTSIEELKDLVKKGNRRR